MYSTVHGNGRYMQVGGDKEVNRNEKTLAITAIKIENSSEEALSGTKSQ